MSSLVRRSVSAAIALGLVAAASSPVAADPVREGETAAWLGGQLISGLAPASFGDGADHGLTADVVIALDALGDPDEAAASADALGAVVGDYVTYESDPDSMFPGEAGKTAAAARAAGRDPQSFGGIDLVALVERAVTTTGEPVGAAHEAIPAFDYVGPVNSIGQSWAARALVEAGSDLADETVGYLLRQQCPGGQVRLQVADEPCAAAPGLVSLDTTAIALDALVRARQAGISPTSDIEVPTLDAAITAAADALVGAQASDGSLQDAGVANSNTTGLAAVALASAGRDDAARAAALWVTSLRVPSTATGPLASSVGAIAYSRPALDAAADSGISGSTRDQWLRATAQAALALPLAPSAALSIESGAGRYAAPGTTVRVTIGGLGADEDFVVSGGRVEVTGTSSDDGSASLDVALPDRVGLVRLELQAGSGAASAEIELLAPAEFDITLPASVTAGQRFDVDVAGARDDEPVRVEVIESSTAVATPEVAAAAPAGTVAAGAATAVAPGVPGDYVVVVTSAVAQRSGVSETIAVTVGGDGAATPPGGGDLATGAGDLVPIARDTTLPNGGSEVPLWALWAALASVLGGGVLVARTTNRNGAHR